MVSKGRTTSFQEREVQSKKDVGVTEKPRLAGTVKNLALVGVPKA